MISFSHILRILLLVSIIMSAGLKAVPQEDINRTDDQGNKQGHWVKRYPDGQIMYEGYFVDNEPSGEFKRYDEKGNLVSVLEHNMQNDTVMASFYHPNGFIAGKGKYFRQKKTGEWLYYSDYVENHLLMRTNYSKGELNGIRYKYHWNGEVAEILLFDNGLKSGKWRQYFDNGTLCLEANYNKGELNGGFRSWHTNGTTEIKGTYRENTRTGSWFFYNKDGSLRRKIEYVNGIPQNRAELIKEETEYLDKLEKEGGKISDPEETGVIIK